MPALDTTAQLADRYRLLEKLGEGGMGAVYKAHDAKLDRTVAVKVMAAHLVSHPDSLARFQREAKALAKVAHPGIVQAFDTDCDGDQHYLVMEFVEGHSLFHVVRSQGRIAPTHAADYGYQAALALHHAHDRGLIHRDIKPHNLLLTPAGQVKVLDLGLARFDQDHVGDSGLTREGVGMGSPDYMAPEQFAHANRADERSDIYSLGCTLFHLVCGRVVYPGTSLAAKSRAHEEQEPPRLEDLCPEAPVGLALAVRKMLAKEPDARFQSMQEVAEALAPYVAGSSISLPVIEKTSNWEGSQLSFHTMSLRSTKGGNGATPTTPTVHRDRTRQRRLNWLVGGIAAAAVLVVVLLLIRRPAGEPDSGAPAASASGESASVAPGSAPVVRVPIVPTTTAASNVRTVSKDAEGGGQFRTIGEALENATPRMTIRVLDDAVYTESLLLNEPEHHTGLKLEAANGATIRMPPGEQHAIRIAGVADVEIRGFRFATGTGTPAPRQGMVPTFIRVESRSPGVLMEKLSMKSAKPVCGVQIFNLGLSEADAPILVRHCQIEVGYCGINVSGRAGTTANNVCLHENRIVGGAKGIGIELSCKRIHATGNVLHNSNMAGLEFRSMNADSTDILIANNTFHGGGFGMRVWLDPPYIEPTKDQVAVRNNVWLGASVCDCVFIRFDPDEPNARGDDSAFLLDLWRFDHNWRDQVGASKLQLIPLAPEDRKLDGDEFVSLDAAEADFLRPRKDSPLAAQGAGRTDPRLPSYVGAVPPEGVPPWDWDRTYRTYKSVGAPAPKDGEPKP